jgi:glutamate-1-semialdehyde 2,1-aminomutase
MIISRQKLSRQLSLERERFAASHTRSRAMFERARKSLLAGVPMNWMVRWAGDFPIFVSHGEGAKFTDIDGHTYLDFCLGDTGAMTGHAPGATVEAMRHQLGKGLTFMLPGEDAVWVGEELSRRFGLPFWQMAMTATDANRFVIRLARHITGRSKILVFNWCYHGSVDETFATIQRDGSVGPRPGNLGPPVNPAATTKVVEFNDIPALERALTDRDVACVLTEPALTNIGIVLPDPGFHDALRRLTRETGTLLVMDETHTICAGPGGCTKANGLDPDFLTIGKPIGGGMPVAAYGMSAEVAARVQAMIEMDMADTGGIGGTLSGNALAIAAIRATLDNVLTAASYEHTIPLARRFVEGVESVIRAYRLPWIVKQLGCRAEYWFHPNPPRNGGEAAAAIDGELDRYMHLCALNRGILMTPFHNMALIAPQTTEADIDHHTLVFRESVEAILS